MTAALELALARGGSALVTDTDGDRVTLLSTASSPPGSTLELSLAGEAYKVKVRGCRRVSEPDAAGRCFRIEGRWVSLTRAQRERVTSTDAGGREHEP
jgi:hypothetical protein